MQATFFSDKFFSLVANSLFHNFDTLHLFRMATSRSQTKSVGGFVGGYIGCTLAIRFAGDGSYLFWYDATKLSTYIGAYREMRNFTQETSGGPEH
jgi:hypothetical protein